MSLRITVVVVVVQHLMEGCCGCGMVMGSECFLFVRVG